MGAGEPDEGGRKGEGEEEDGWIGIVGPAWVAKVGRFVGVDGMSWGRGWVWVRVWDRCLWGLGV